MSHPAHQLRRLPKPRFVFVAVPADALHSLLWWLLASLTGRLADWTGWAVFEVFQFAATGWAVLLAVLALHQWRLRARRR